MATILESIASGKYDKSLDRIIIACRQRQEDRIYELKPGEKVKFNNLARPEYLRGQVATILSWRRTRVLIQLDAPVGRFLRGNGKIIAHASSLIPVEV